MSAAIHASIDALDIDPNNKRRIKMALECPDSAFIPRVTDAGRVFAASPQPYQLMHNGTKVIADGYIGPWVTELIRFCGGVHEPQEERAFAEILKYMPDDATMVELGSWWAYYSLWFQMAVKNAHNFMLEPDPNNLDVGVRNFALNGDTGRWINAAIGAESEDSILYRCLESDNLERSIPQLCVDDLIAREKIKYVDLLLADIQGAELEMLEGSRRSLDQGLIRFVVISTHHHDISHDPLIHQKCLEFIKARGGHVLAEHSVPESYSGDGLIVASFKPQDRNLPIIPISRNSARNSLFGELEYDLARALDDRRNWEVGFQSKELERQALETALANKERDRQALETALAGKERDRQVVETALAARERDRQTLEMALGEKESQRAQLEAALQRTSSDLRKLQQELEIKRSYESELERRLAVLESELTGVRTEAHRWWTETDRWWREADRYRLLLEAVYGSLSWRVTAPVRALHLRERIRSAALGLFLILRRIPITDRLLTALRTRIPGPWAAIARRVKPPAPAGDYVQAALPPTEIAAAPADELHFLNLLRRGLARRTQNGAP